jgi:hypothetical protein
MATHGVGCQCLLPHQLHPGLFRFPAANLTLFHACDVSAYKFAKTMAAACIWPFLYKLLRQYDEEQQGGASLEEGKGGKGEACKTKTDAFVEVRRHTWLAAV